MEIAVQADAANEVLVWSLRGRLDVAGVQAIEAEFKRQTQLAAQPVLLEMSGVEFMGSLGIRLLLAAAKELQQRSLPMVFLKPTALVEDTWYSAGLAEIVPVEHDFDSAVAACRERGG